MAFGTQLVDFAGWSVNPSSFIGGCSTEIMTNFQEMEECLNGIPCQASFGQARLGSGMWLNLRMRYREISFQYQSPSLEITNYYVQSS